MNSVFNFKKPSRIIIAAAIVLVAALSVGFAVNRAMNNSELPSADSVISVSMNQYNEFVPSGEITITDKSEITQILNALSGATKTWRQSVNDTPLVGDYLRVSMNLAEGERASRTLFLYADGEDYIEQPYVGIYRLKNRINYLYSVYAAYTGGSGQASVPVNMNTPFISEDDSQKTTQIDSIPSEWFSNLDGNDMTLDDVREFATKGYELTLYDFLTFKGVNGAEIPMYDQYSMIFNVQDGYELTVRANPDADGMMDIVSFSRIGTPDGIELRMGGINALNLYLQEFPDDTILP